MGSTGQPPEGDRRDRRDRADADRDPHHPHFHPDHLGLADWLRGQTGAVVRMHELENRAMRTPVVLPDELLEEWDVPAVRREEIAAIRGMAPSVVEADELVRGNVVDLARRAVGWKRF